jgi:hypothetical protein
VPSLPFRRSCVIEPQPRTRFFFFCELSRMKQTDSSLIGCLASIAPSAASLSHLHTHSMRHGLCACFKSQLLTTMGTRPGSSGAYLYASALPLRQFPMECSVLGWFGLRSGLLHRNLCTCLATLYEWHYEFGQVTSFSLVGVNAIPGHDRDPPSYN